MDLYCLLSSHFMFSCSCTILKIVTFIQFLKHFKTQKGTRMGKADSSSLNLNEEKPSLRNEEMSEGLGMESWNSCALCFSLCILCNSWDKPGHAQTLSCIARTIHFWNILLNFLHLPTSGDSVETQQVCD